MTKNSKISTKKSQGAIKQGDKWFCVTLFTCSFSLLLWVRSGLLLLFAWDMFLLFVFAFVFEFFSNFLIFPRFFFFHFKKTSAKHLKTKFFIFRNHWEQFTLSVSQWNTISTSIYSAVSNCFSGRIFIVWNFFLNVGYIFCLCRHFEDVPTRNTIEREG